MNSGPYANWIKRANAALACIVVLTNGACSPHSGAEGAGKADAAASQSASTDDPCSHGVEKTSSGAADKLTSKVSSACGPDAKGLCIDDNPVIEVPDGGAASGLLRVCNKGTESQPLALAIGDFVAVGWDGVLYQLNTTPSLSIRTDSDAEPFKSDALPGNVCVRVHLAASRLLETGPMLAKLSLGAKPFAYVSAYRTTTPFHLSIDGSSGGKPALSVSKGSDGAKPGQTAAVIPIVNGDGVAYLFDWTLELGDSIIAQGTKRIAPGGRTHLCAKFDENAEGRLFTRRDSGFITPNRKEGRLLLQRHAEGAMTNHKMDSTSIPVTASLSYYGVFGQALANAAFVFILLLAGVLASLGINFAIPMLRKKVALKQALAVQERMLNGQGSIIGSRTLSTLRLELRRLWAAIASQSAFFPDTENVLTALDARIKSLGQRIDITREASRHLATLKTGHLLALHEADGVAAQCIAALQIVELASPSDADLQKAQSLLSQATAVINASAGTPATEAVLDLAARRKELVDKLPLSSLLPPDPGEPPAMATPPARPPDAGAEGGQQPGPKNDPGGAAPQQSTVEEQTLQNAIHQKNWAELANRLTIFKTQGNADSAPTRAQYVEEAEQVWVAEKLWQFSRLVASAETSTVYHGRLDCAEKLLSCLEPGANWSTQAAAQTLKQIRQNVSKGDIVAALSPKALSAKPRIDVDPPTPMPFQITDFRIVLGDDGLNASDARRLVECRWTVDQAQVEGKEFSIYYFFEP